MESKKDIEQEESMRSREVFGEIERFYSREWYLGKREGFREYERVGRYYIPSLLI